MRISAFPERLMSSLTSGESFKKDDSTKKRMNNKANTFLNIFLFGFYFGKKMIGGCILETNGTNFNKIFESIVKFS